MLEGLVNLNYTIASLRVNMWVLGSEAAALTREHLDLSLAAPIDSPLAKGTGNLWSKTRGVEENMASGYLEGR